MSRAVALNLISRAVLSGIERAVKDADARFGMWLNEVPEYYVTTKVGESLAASLGDKGWVYLEKSSRSVLKESRACTTGRHSKVLGKKSRFDLTVCYSDNRPRAVVEIKSPVYCMDASIRRDVERLCRTISRGAASSSLQCGILGMYTDATIPSRKDATSSARVRRFASTTWPAAVKAIVDKFGLRASVLPSRVRRIRHEHLPGFEAWMAVVIVVSP